MTENFLIKINKVDYAKAERILIRSLIDRKSICNAKVLLELNNDKDNYYIVLEGESCSAKAVCAIFKKIATNQNIECSMFRCNSTKHQELIELIKSKKSNSYGRVMKDYKTSRRFNTNLVRVTNKFLIEHKIMSGLAFCPKCEGYCEAVELSSSIGEYKCVQCGISVGVEGPLRTDSVEIKHLNAEEQLYLIGVKELKRSNLHMIKTRAKKKDSKKKELVHVKRSVPIVCNEKQQMYWNISYTSKQVEESRKKKIKLRNLMTNTVGKQPYMGEQLFLCIS